MGFSLSDLDPSRIVKKIPRELKRIEIDIKKEAEKALKKLEEEGKRVLKDGETAVRKTRDALRKAGDDIAKEVDHVTGINLKPIVKSLAGPLHIMVRITEGKNIADATTDWVVQTVEGGGEIAGVLGSDVETAVETIIAASNLHILVLGNLSGDGIKVVQGREDFDTLLGSPLAALIRQAHGMYAPYAEKLPDDIKLLLADVVPTSTLKRARYVIDRSPNNIAGLANALHSGEGRNHAVTLDDIIVFAAPPPKNLSGFMFWVHELHHVRQYADMGILKFAEQYTKDHEEIEEDAAAAALAAESVLRQKLELVS